MNMVEAIYCLAFTNYQIFTGHVIWHKLIQQPDNQHIMDQNKRGKNYLDGIKRRRPGIIFAAFLKKQIYHTCCIWSFAKFDLESS